MDRNIFLEIEYVGTNYFGFQIQNKRNQISIQKVLEDALQKLFKEEIRIQYCSRTDRGVHARSQGVNFTTCSTIPLQNIKNALNSFLPTDVKVKKAKRVGEQFHSRFCAKSKIYRYIIRNKKEQSVFWTNSSWHMDAPLDIEKMKKASKLLLGKRDFFLFAKDAAKYKDCIRELKNISIKKRASLVYIDIEANGFLRNMARNIVSFLVKVGTGQIDTKDISGILKRKIGYVNKPAPACGLYLLKVNYEKQ